jgi:phosphoribosylglycinamide formyltransferase 2
MLIGTPLTSSAIKVMLLGSGELGKELAIAMQRLGLEVIAVDRYANAPAHQVAHRAHVIALTDGAALRRLIEQERPQFVVPEYEALSADALAQIEREGIARVVPTARAVQLTSDREGIRRLAAEKLGLPTPRYRFVEDQAALQRAIEERDGIGYPCVVKPVMSSSGRGQSVVRARGEIAQAWKYAESTSRVPGGHAIVETYIGFDYEITLLTVRAADADGGTATHHCAPIGHLQVQGSYVESWQPQPMSDAALAKAQAIATAVAADLGGHGIFGVELFVKGDDVWFSEVSPRPHDTGLVTMCTQAQDEFELHTRAFLGLPVDVSLREPGASAVIHGSLDARGIRYEGIAHALAVPGTALRLFGKPDAYRKRRMGVALANGGDVDEARARARECAARVTPLA